MARPKLGIALGSGGARGLAHCGVLQALHEASIPIDIIAGTSMGALVGALYARRPDPEAVWTSLSMYVDDHDVADQWAAFVPNRGSDSTDGVRPWHGLFDFMQRNRIAVKTVTLRAAESDKRLRGPLARLFAGYDVFADLALPMATVALDVVSGEQVVFREGSLLDGLYASCAIPGVFPPFEPDDRVIVDGGGPFRVPVEACREMGADFVIAVDIPAYEEARLRTGFDLGMRSNAIARNRLNEFVCASADMLIRPDVGHVHWADFRAGAEARRLGQEATFAALPELRRRWNRRRSPLMRMFGRAARAVGGAA